MEQSYKVKLDLFEGPLDLLLHLINHYEIDIYDIPVSKITDQYLQYIHAMKTLELSIASEYLVMAATLLYIKSQMLLPKQEVDAVDDEFMGDPREELTRRLLEYRKYKEAAEALKEKELGSSRTYTRAAMIFEELESSSQPMIEGEVSIYDMLLAFGKMMERKKWDHPLDTRIQRIEIPIEQRMEEIYEKVKLNKNGIDFNQLFAVRTRHHIVVTFIAILELMKNKQVYCKQEKHFESLLICYREGMVKEIPV